MNGSFTVFEAKADQKLFGYFRAHGFAVLKDALTSDEVMHFVQLYDKDRRFFRVKCGNETYYRKARLPHEFKLIAILPTMVLETPIYTLLMISTRLL